MKNNTPTITIFTVLAQGWFSAIVILGMSLFINDKGIKQFVPFAAIIVVVLAVLALISITQVVSTAKKIEQARILKAHLHTVDELMNTLHAERHEYTRHIQTIQAMLYLGESDKAQEYLDGVAQKYWNDDGIIYIGEPLLTGLINSKRSMAASMGIDFGFAFKCDPTQLPMEPWDLCSVMGNLIDNALEAAILAEDEKKNVGIELKDENNEYVLYVYNTGPKIKSPEQIFTPGYTSKGSKGRGYGLYIVKQLVEGCGGYVELQTLPRTTFIIHLPRRDKSDGKKLKHRIGHESGKAASL